MIKARKCIQVQSGHKIVQSRSFCMRSLLYLPWPNRQSAPFLDLNWMLGSYLLLFFLGVELCSWHYTVLSSLQSVLVCLVYIHSISLRNQQIEHESSKEEHCDVFWFCDISKHCSLGYVCLCVPVCSLGHQLPARKWTGNAKQNRLPERLSLSFY